MSRFSLHNAIKSGDTGAVNELLAHGADVNAPNDAGQTPLILAIVGGHHQLLRQLLRAGANPLLRDNTGLSAIDWAERKGETELAQALTKHSQSQSLDSSTSAAGIHAENHKTSQTSLEDAPRTPLSQEERTRRFIAGLKLRLDEKASREPTSYPTALDEKQPASDVKHNEVRETISETVQSDRVTTEQHSEALPLIPEGPPELTTRSATQKAPAQEKPFTQQKTQEPDRKPVNPLDLVAAEIVPKVDVAATHASPAFSSQSPLQRPTRSSSKRKRCPRCGTVYNSELLAYCSYDSVELVDADQAIVTPPLPNSSVLLWVMTVIVLVLGALAGLFVTSSLLRSRDSKPQTVVAPQPPASQKGIPVAGRQLAGKELSLPEAEVPGNTVHQPGTVTVRVRIDRDGRVYSATSEEGDEALRDAAVAAAKKSTFSVEKLRGRPSEGTIIYTFK